MISAIHWIEEVWSRLQFILRISTVYSIIMAKIDSSAILRRYH